MTDQTLTDNSKAPTEVRDVKKEGESPTLINRVQDQQVQDQQTVPTATMKKDASADSHLPKVELVAHPETSQRKLNENGEYIVQKNDMLSYIAKDLLGPNASTRDIYNFVNVIARDNNLDSADKIDVNQHLKIRVAAPPQQAETTAEKANKTVVPANDQTGKPGAANTQSDSKQIAPALTPEGNQTKVQPDVPVPTTNDTPAAVTPQAGTDQAPAQTTDNPTNQATDKTTDPTVAPNPEQTSQQQPDQTYDQATSQTFDNNIGTLSKAAHVGGLALDGAGDYLSEHPLLIAAETAGGVIIGGALVATAPAWVTATVAVGGIGYLGKVVYDKSKEVMPALNTLFEDQPEVEQYKKSENIIKTDLGTGLVDGTIMVAGGIGTKMIAHKFGSKAAGAAAAESEEVVVEEAVKQVPKTPPPEPNNVKSPTNAKADSTPDSTPDNTPKTGANADSTPDSTPANTPDSSLKAGADTNKDVPKIDEVTAVPKTPSAEKSTAAWEGNKYKNADGTFRQEDSHFVSADGRVAVVADGVGGNGGGDVASKITTDVFSERMKLLPDGATREESETWLKESVDQAAAKIKQAKLDKEYVAPDGTVIPAKSQMASTVVASVKHEDQMLIAWAGDSRAYRLRGGKLEQLTHDHSWENEMVDNGIMTMEQAQAQDKGHIISSALGSKLKIGQVVADIKPGDRFLLASDGLERLSAPEIESVLNASKTPAQSTEKLLQAVQDKHAIEKGYQDNTTMVVLDPILPAPTVLPKGKIFPPKLANPLSSGRVTPYLVMPGIIQGEDELNQQLDIPRLAI